MNTLEQEVLELIGEDPSAPDVFLDTDDGMAQIRTSISDAIQEIAMLTGGYKRQYLLPLRADTMFYRLRLQNGDLGWITDVWSVTNKRRLEQTDLIRLNAHNPRWMLHSADPWAYCPIGKDIIGFYPKPPASSNVMDLMVVEIPSAYESSRDRVKLRESFKYATIHYAVSEFWASRGDAQEAQKHFQLYLDAMGLKQDYAERIESTGMQSKKDPWPTVTT